MQRPLRLAYQLGTQDVIVVFDQAIKERALKCCGRAVSVIESPDRLFSPHLRLPRCHYWQTILSCWACRCSERIWHYWFWICG